jgi:chromosome segregation ATPase
MANIIKKQGQIKMGQQKRPSYSQISFWVPKINPQQLEAAMQAWRKDLEELAGLKQKIIEVLPKLSHDKQEEEKFLEKLNQRHHMLTAKLAKDPDNTVFQKALNDNKELISKHAAQLIELNELFVARTKDIDRIDQRLALGQVEFGDTITTVPAPSSHD